MVFPRGVTAATSRRSYAVCMNNADDPTGSPVIKAIDALQEALQQSPVASLKKGLAKLQAGDYDEVAFKAKLETMIKEQPAIMFSFTT